MKKMDLKKYSEIVENDYVLFKITPHQSALNSTNRRLLASLHDLLSMYNSPLSRISREGFKFYFREKDELWWIVDIQAKAETNSGGEEEIKRQISFYLGITKPFASVLITKFKNHDQWKKCTIEELPIDTIKIPQESDIYKMKYQRHNMFSLKYDYTMQTTPIREICSISQEMGEGDYAGIFIRSETLSRRKWKGLVDYAWGEWVKGKVPERNRLDIYRLWRKLYSFLYSTAKEFKSIIDSAMNVFENMFNKERRQEVLIKNESKSVDPEREEILINGDLSTATKNKRNLPVFNTDIFLVVNSDSKEKKEMLVRSASSAFNELKGDNRLNPVKINIRYTLDQWPKILGKQKDYDVNQMSTEEVGKLCQLPTRDVQDEFKEELQVNRKVEVDIPKTFLDKKGIYMGTATNRGETFDIHLPTDDVDMLMTSRAFIGSPRTGKDQAAINLIVESKRQHGIGAIVPDVIDERSGHRGMADAIRDHLPPEDVIDLNLGDFDWPVYIGLDSAVKGMKNERIAANRIAQELTNFLMADDIENHQTREYLREAAKITKGDLTDMELFLTYDNYRAQRIEQLKKQGKDMAFWEDYHNMSDGKRGQIYGPIITRLGELKGDDFLKPIFCQRPQLELDIRRWLAQGKVIIYRIPSRELGEMAVKTIMHWIVLTYFLTKLSMGGEGKPTWLVLNEPHQFLSKGLIHFTKRLLSEGPKYKIAPVFLFHNFKQLPNDFVEVLLSSSLNWHIFKNTNDQVYSRLSNYLQPTFTPETAMTATKRFQYIACWLDKSGEYQTPFMVNAPDLISKRYESMDNSWLTKRHSRQYGRNVIAIEKELKQRKLKALKNGTETQKTVAESG